MRKVMAVVFALVIMTCSSFSMAEGIDISTLSDDELVALMARVQEEIVARHIEGTANLAGGHVHRREGYSGRIVHLHLLCQRRGLG